MGLFDRRAGKGTPFDWLVVGLGNPGKEYARTRLGGATEWTWEVLRDKAMLAGTPDDVGEKLQELEELGIRYVNCWPGAGGYPHRKIMETLALFGSDVLPKFARAA